MSGRNEGIIMSGGSLTAGQLAVGRGATTQQNGTGAAPLDPAEAQRELQALLAQLTQALKAAPATHAEESEAVAAQATQLVRVAAKPEPNRGLLQVAASGLHQTAEFLKDVVPNAVVVAGQIVTLISRLHQLGG
jgi:hypothetical protein